MKTEALNIVCHTTALESEELSIRNGCTGCGACRSQCAFLRKYGLPNEIVDTYDFSRADHQAIAYECSLCGLCGAVCPEKVDPGELFLAVRREAVDGENVDLSKYRVILGYEKRGSSPLFAYYGLPQGCDTVFFPGCTLPGTRPKTTRRLFDHMRQHIANLGIVMDCCTKPSHDLGRQEHFSARFDEMRSFLVSSGIRKVIVACPNCYKIFREYGEELAVRTVYEEIDVLALPADSYASSYAAGELAVHDPCPLRYDTDIQDAVRSLLTRMGLTVREMKHNRSRTLCCGEGGSVGFTHPELACQWGEIRKEEANGVQICTYCAGCAGFLGRITPTVHLIDLLFDTRASQGKRPKVARAPFTYLNRLIFKRRFRKILFF